MLRDQVRRELRSHERRQPIREADVVCHRIGAKQMFNCNMHGFISWRASAEQSRPVIASMQGLEHCSRHVSRSRARARSHVHKVELT